MASNKELNILFWKLSALPLPHTHRHFQFCQLLIFSGGFPRYTWFCLKREISILHLMYRHPLLLKTRLCLFIFPLLSLSLRTTIFSKSTHNLSRSPTISANSRRFPTVLRVWTLDSNVSSLGSKELLIYKSTDMVEK